MSFLPTLEFKGKKNKFMKDFLSFSNLNPFI